MYREGTGVVKCCELNVWFSPRRFCKKEEKGEKEKEKGKKDREKVLNSQ